MKRPPRLWVEVPESARATEADVLNSWGAREPWWLARRRVVLKRPLCQAAVRFRKHLWLPCLNAPLNGSRFCRRHWAMAWGAVA